MADVFRLRVLGGFALVAPSGARIARLPQRRAEAVLALLAVAGEVGCTRDRLAGLLWPESDEAHARHGLRDTLHAIRQAIAPEAVLASGDALRLDLSIVRTDLAEFELALAGPDLERAVAAYRGPLLEGFQLDDAPEFERWLDRERTRLAHAFVTALERLGAEAESSGKRGEAAEWWRRAVEQDPVNSRLVIRHARALTATGDRGNALRVLDAHVRRLRSELEVDPDPEFLAEAARIRAGAGPGPVPPRAAAYGSGAQATEPPASAEAGPVSGAWLTASSDGLPPAAPFVRADPVRRPTWWPVLLGAAAFIVVAVAALLLLR